MIKYELRAGDPAGDPAARPCPVHAHGIYHDKDFAVAKLAELQARIEAGGGRNKAYWLHEIDTDEHWQLPSERHLRLDYALGDTVTIERGPGVWNTTETPIIDTRKPEGVLFLYERDYPGRPPFEPFRQGDRDYALISPHYEETAVVDLEKGAIVASFDEGFCPVGFYVPDWRDVRDGSVVPGSLYWDDRSDRWPDGTLGFAWGCIWGDDNGWKVQAVNLEKLSEGVVTLEERWGYLRLDCITDNPADFIRVHEGESGSPPRVEFSVPRHYDVAGTLLDSGAGWDGDQ
jgi:hypothetical protein